MVRSASSTESSAPMVTGLPSASSDTFVELGSRPSALPVMMSRAVAMGPSFVGESLLLRSIHLPVPAAGPGVGRTGVENSIIVAVELSGCVIANGMPGAGKSTVATLGARLLPRAAGTKGDDVNQMILSGRVWFAGEPPEEAARQVELCHRNMCSLAANFVDFGSAVLMDTVVADRAELDFLLTLLAPRPVRLVTL